MTIDSGISPERRLALTMLVMATTFIQVLDATIANVALPHMRASLSATPETISWVLTSYIVAAAVATPLTGWLEARIGRRALLLWAVGGFSVASMLCGVSTTLPMMVGARVLQGLFGAFLSPLSQAVMLDLYPPSQRAKALMIWGMGVMIAPIAGPILGGWLTEAYNWRWVFFINVPVGAVALAGLVALMPRFDTIRVRFDMVGFGLLTVALASLQLVLDRGSQLDWFNSIEILIETGLFVAVFWMFVIHTLKAPYPLIPRALFVDRNFMLANLFMLVSLGLMMSSAALLPPMLQGLFGYDTFDAGLVMLPRGIAMMAGMILASRLTGKVDIRYVIAIGILFVASAHWIMAGFSLQMGNDPLLTSGALQGAGIGLIMMPMNMIAFATLAPALRTNGAAIYNLSRNIGGAIAIAAFAALLATNHQVSHADLTSHLATTRFPLIDMVAGSPAGQAAVSMLDLEINRQALMIAYIDDFWLMALLTLGLLPLVVFLNPLKSVHRDPAEPIVLE